MSEPQAAEPRPAPSQPVERVPAPPAMVAPPVDDMPPPIELPSEAYGGRGGRFDDGMPPPIDLPDEAYGGRAEAPGRLDDMPPPIGLPSDAPPAASRMDEPRTEAAPLDGARLRRAWESMLRDGDGVAPGTLLFLKAARVSLEGGGQVKVELPPGSPILDRLASPTVKRAMEESLSRRLAGAQVRLAFSATGPAPQASEHRITAEFARKDRLQRLMEGEPVLTAAVQAWDLELVD